MALSRLKLAYADFLAITPREFLVILDAFNRNEFEKYKRDQEDKRFWHVANMNFQLPTEKQYTDPKQWMPFAWETSNVKVLTDEEIESKIEVMSKAWGI